MNSQALPQGSLLNNRYRIERVLGQGGFGITYLAVDIQVGGKVAVKEFFPKDFCDRNDDTSSVVVGTKSSIELVALLKKKFLKEAENISRFNHQNIVRLYNYFEQHDTAYYVMEYIDGMSLSEIVKTYGPLNVDESLYYIERIGDALQYIHNMNVNHLDVKPANIMVRRSDGEPLLIDFGLSKQYDDGGSQTSSTPTGKSHGYAPREQYVAGGVSAFSPQSDVYSLGATLYYILTGVVPPNAIELSEEELMFPATVPEWLINPICTAMAPARQSRYSSVAAFIRAIGQAKNAGGNNGGGGGKGGNNGGDGGRENVKQKSHRGWLWWLILLVVISAGAIGYSYLGKKDKKDVEPTQSTSYERDKSGEIINEIDGDWVKRIAEPDDEDEPEDEDEEILRTGDLIQFWMPEFGGNFVYIEGGNFIMGSDYGGYADNQPAHIEYVDDFLICETKVPQSLWEEVMGYNNSEAKGKNLPVTNMTHAEADDFVKLLNDMLHNESWASYLEVRLPTEAEWEYVAKELGLVDQLGMTNGILEYTSDYYSSDYNSERDGYNPYETNSKYYVARGEGNIIRTEKSENTGYTDVGIRLVIAEK